MTLPYSLKARSSVRSVVSHDSPPTKILPTSFSAISTTPNPNQIRPKSNSSNLHKPPKKNQITPQNPKRAPTNQGTNSRLRELPGGETYLAARRRPRACSGRGIRVLRERGGDEMEWGEEEERRKIWGFLYIERDGREMGCTGRTCEIGSWAFLFWAPFTRQDWIFLGFFGKECWSGPREWYVTSFYFEFFFSFLFLRNLFFFLLS